MDVNLFGVIHGLSTLLPLVTSHSSTSSPASVVITGSKQGITNPPGNPAYNASKAAVKALAEHLSFDLSKSSPTTSVHLLVPGWTFTGLSGNSPFATGSDRKEKPVGAWSPDQVVEYLETKMQEGKFYIICPDNGMFLYPYQIIVSFHESSGAGSCLKSQYISANECQFASPYGSSAPGP